MSDWFELDERLAASTVTLGNLALSRVLLSTDARFPWLILVPRIAGAVEIADLHESDAIDLMREARLAAAALRSVVPCDKLNLAAIGNVVPQLHVHVVARTAADAAWPGPVWGFGTSEPYKPDALSKRISDVQDALGL